MEEEKKEKVPSTFDLLVSAMSEAPQTTKALAEIIVKNSKDSDYTEERAAKTVSTRINHLKKKGYTIEKTDAGYSITC